VIAATTQYGVEFTSAIWKDNIVAFQFHPEKSQSQGLHILKQFGEWVLQV
jgi:glutamine amidotransferase